MVRKKRRTAQKVNFSSLRYLSDVNLACTV